MVTCNQAGYKNRGCDMAKYIVLLKGMSDTGQRLTRAHVFGGGEELDTVREWVDGETTRCRFIGEYIVELRVEVET